MRAEDHLSFCLHLTAWCITVFIEPFSLRSFRYLYRIDKDVKTYLTNAKLKIKHEKYYKHAKLRRVINI